MKNLYFKSIDKFFKDNNFLNLHKHKSRIISYFIIISWILMIFGRSFANGFDFSDTTLTYNFSLRVLDGEIPFKDFHTTVMPLAYYVEAFFLSIFGKSYLINQLLGISLKIFQAVFIFHILNFFYLKNYKSLLITLFIVSFVGTSHPFSYFSFTPLAITLSLLSVYLALISTKNSYYSFPLGITIAFTFFAKQNFGVALILSYFAYQLFIFFKNKPQSFNFRESILFLTGLLIVFLPIFFYFDHNGLIPEIKYILTSGTERKGITNLSEFIWTLLPRYNSKSLYITSAIAGIISYFIFYKKLRIFYAYLITVSALGFINIFNEGTFVLGEKIFASNIIQKLVIINLFEVPKFLIIFLLIYFFFAKLKANKKSAILFLLMSLSLILVHELGWVGSGHRFYRFTLPLLFLIPLILNNEEDLSKNFLKDIFNKLLLSLNILIGIFLVFYGKTKYFREFPTTDTTNFKDLLFDYKISPQHKKAIEKFSKISTKDCKEKNSFVFPWAPILYQLTETKNITKFFLPYHDWITEKEADEIINTLSTKKPCLLIIEKVTFNPNGRATPFPAIGMKKIEKFMRGNYLDQYEKIEIIETFKKDHVIFKRK